MLVRTKGGGERGGEGVELFQELYQIHEGRADPPVMPYRTRGKWKVWTKGQATECLRQGLSVVAEEWENKEKCARVRLIPDEFVLTSGRIGGALRFAAIGTSPLVIQEQVVVESRSKRARVRN